MGKRLVIAEKPSVAKDIAAALGDFAKHEDYLESKDLVVTWSVGHLLQLASPETYNPELRRWKLDALPMLPDHFDLEVRGADTPGGQRAQARLKAICELIKRPDITRIVNACDAGREGELIFRWIVEYSKTKKPIERLWLQSMTKQAIQDGFGNLRPGSEYEGLAAAAWCRSIGDWLVGLNASRAIKLRVSGNKAGESWSAGRVQTPTLFMVVERERRILAHVPRTYWTIDADFEHEKQTWTASLLNPAAKEEKSDDGERSAPNPWFDRAAVDRVISALRERRTGVASEKRSRSTERAPALFDLTTLQKTANNKAGFSAKRTLDAAQRLYDTHKVLTYPRTDSRYLPDDYGPQVHHILEQLSSESGLGDVARQVLKAGPQNLDRVLDGAKVSDHFAIIPTGTAPEKPLTGDDLRIYELVCQQFVAAFMGPAVYAKVERVVEIAGTAGETLAFRATAKTLEEPGYLAAFGKEGGEGKQLPALIPGLDRAEGVQVALVDWSETAAETRPPSRFTEAGLLGRMESAGKDVDDAQLAEALRERGLGTPATRADTIENLIKKSYLRRVEKSLAATALGMRLIDLLERAHADSLCSPALTGDWEQRLSEVQRGRTSRAEMQAELVEFTSQLTTTLKGFDRDALYAGEPSLGPCPSGDGGEVRENIFGYACSHNKGKDAGCRFMIWKEKAGRYIDRRVAEALVRDRVAGPIEGIDIRSNTPVTVHMRIAMVEDGKWELDVQYGEEVSETGPEEVIGVLCPDPMFPDSEIVETTRRYVSRKLLSGELRKGAPVLPKLVCMRPVTEEEARAYFSEAARTPMIEGWISKRGRPFTGALIRQESGRHRFEFPPRGARGAKAPAEAGEGEEQGAPIKAAKVAKAVKAKAGSAKAAPKAEKPAAKAAAKAAKPAAKSEAAASKVAASAKKKASTPVAAAPVAEAPAKVVRRRPAGAGKEST